MISKRIEKFGFCLLAVLLATMLCFGFAPAVFAMESGAEENSETEQEEKAGAEEPEVKSGSCGANLSWSFSGGTLTISGSGGMTDFKDEVSVPWHAFREDILNVVLPEGIISIGRAAFYGCKNIVTIIIPDSVTKIGDFAFTYCSGIKTVVFGNGVSVIGEEAFANCISVVGFKFPGSLRSIGRKAFYRCESITSIAIPSGVTDIGAAAFGYCINLVSADIKANISTIPVLLFKCCEKLSRVTLPDTVESVEDNAFKDCENLDTVYYNGEDISSEEMQEEIGGNVSVSSGSSSGETTGSTVVDNGDGTVTSENTTVTEGENSTVSTTTETTVSLEEGTTETSEAEVIVTITGEKGWEEVGGAIEKVVDEYGTADDGSEKHVGIDIFLQKTESIDGEFVEFIAGKDITVTITTENGSVWKINGKNINTAELFGNYSLAYVLEAGSAELCEELGASTCFILRFLYPAEINAEVLIRIGGNYARRSATLFQKGKELGNLQSSIVDNDGYAHFYLASVTEETEYYIALDVAGTTEKAIIPQNMLAEYGNPEYIEPIRYEITGRTSSWGMNLGQVMSILAVVMVTVIIFVGAVMYFWNKQRLKNGYVPQMDDEE